MSADLDARLANPILPGLVFASLASGVMQLGELSHVGPLAGRTFILFFLNPVPATGHHRRALRERARALRVTEMAAWIYYPPIVGTVLLRKVLPDQLPLFVRYA